MHGRATVGLGLICAIFWCGCSRDVSGDFRAALRTYQLSRSTQVATAVEDSGRRREVRDAKVHRGGDLTTWLTAHVVLAQVSQTPPSEPKQEQRAPEGLLHWSKRRGPAHPGDVWGSFGRDVVEFRATIWDDTKATFTDPWGLAGMAAAITAGVVLDVANTNGRVADHCTKNRSQLNSFWDSVGDVGGNPGAHLAVAGAMYFSALYREDTKNYEIAKALINALAINGLTTLGLKGIANSESPNGDNFGWPSGHSSSTFCLATVMHEAYGPWVGVPLFAFASFVAYERVDARNHDFNDVISGALIGIVIGHVVYQHHKPRIFGMDVLPYANPGTGAVGVSLSKSW